MSSFFGHDLKMAREQSGLTQKDVAHLLDCNTKEIAAFERDDRLPTLPQLTKLALIFNRIFPSLYTTLRQKARQELFQQLPALPEERQGAMDAFKRDNALKKLEARLADALRKRGDET